MNGACEMNGSNANGTRELKILAGFVAVFVALFFLPVGVPRFDNAIKEGLELTKWYAQEHVLLCLVPALFIAGGISAFVSRASVMRYLGPKANKAVAYGVVMKVMDVIKKAGIDRVGMVTEPVGPGGG